MKIKKERFDAWATSAWTGQDICTPSRVAKAAGISKSSFFFQRSNDYVEASVIIALARALKLSPLGELLKFDEFGSLAELRDPSESEVLSQIAPEFFLEEVLARLHHEESVHDLGAMPAPDGLKRWLDATGMYGSYSEIAERLELANVRVLSKKVNENRLNLGQLMNLCDFGDLNRRLGMVVTGNLTWEEAGFSGDLRANVLRSSTGTTVVDALWSSRKWLERALQVKEIERGVYKSFG